MSLIEKPYGGRAVIEDTMLGGCKIIIPVERKWFLTVFLCIWLCVWVAGEVDAIRSFNSNPVFFLIWISGWTFGGINAINVLIWNLTGMEIIIIQQGELSIEKKGALFARRQTYSLETVQNFRVYEESDFKGRNSEMYGVGTIQFDYGMKTIKFGVGLDEVEATSILTRLASQKLIKYPA